MGRLVETCAWAGGELMQRIPPEWASQVEALAAWIQEHAANLDVYVPMLAAGRWWLGVATDAATTARDAVNSACAGFESWEVALLAVIATLVMLWISASWSALAEDGGLLPKAFKALRSTPPVSWYIQKEKDKLRKDLLAKRDSHSHSDAGSRTGGGKGDGPNRSFLALPEKGFEPDAVITMLKTRAAGDLSFADGQSPLSGAVYIGTAAHTKLLNSAYEMYAIANPLHADVWPSLRQMEAEVVSMTGAMLGGGPGTGVCGAMTSGGTESILMAMKASRDYMRATKGIRHPEMIFALSAHAAYIKACEYFKIKAVVLKVGSDLRLSAKAVRANINANTAMIIASAPGFPHGVVDDIEEIAKIARKARVCLHVDGCLGGFVLPFVRQLPGTNVPPFDFSVKGVTSMSVDTHKYGLAHKGTSVVLYADKAIRQHQYTGITDWSGGLYISPGLAGSRPGALIASAWASLVRHGADGYLKQAAQMMGVAGRFATGLHKIAELEMLGEPVMCLIAFGVAPRFSKRLNIYKVNDLLSQRGWHLNALQSPAALHFCFTPAHTDELVDRLLADLATAVADVLANPACVSGGSAPMYGMSGVVPDRGMINDFLIAYQDVMLEP